MGYCARAVLIICIAFGQMAAADPILDRIHSQLVEIRSKRSAHPLNAFRNDANIAKYRGATPILMDVKHELRDWLEKRLLQFRRDDDPASLARALNKELDAADLTCGATKEARRCTADEWLDDI